MGNELLQTIAGVSGNALEWFDFTLFGYFSDIIAQVFFPPSSTHANLAKSFALFGGAFLCRPFGGMMTGHFGDKYGRKQALVMSLVMMAIPTFAMGCLPSYEQVGGWSTALLIICRLVQGFSVGGQQTASLTYTVEKKPKENWGYYGSMVGMASNFGCLLGNLVAALLRTVLAEDALVQWGWRIPFLCGILIFVVAVYIEYFEKEHSPNADEYAEGEGSGGGEFAEHPYKGAFTKENLPALISAALTPMLHMAGFYITFVWAAIFMDDLIEPPVKNAFWINAMSLLFGNTVFYPVGGWLSDHHGRVRLMVIGGIGVGIIGPFMIYVISLGQSIPAFFAQWSLGVILAMYSGPIHAWLVEKFPSKIRLTSVALGYNIASCTAGAFSPLIATVMVRYLGPVAPGFLYPIFGFLGLIGMFVSSKVHQDGGAVDNKISVEKEGNQILDSDDLGAPLL